MTIYLVRHGSAGDRHTWHGADQLRPLDERGRRQAAGLAQLLGDLIGDRQPRRVQSSPFVRCVETVEPLAERLGAPVEGADALAEGAGGKAVLLIREIAPLTAVLSTHGDVFPVVLDTLARTDGLSVADRYPRAKGSVWALDHDESGVFVRATYLPPPA